jgi:hypothetical protein
MGANTGPHGFLGEPSLTELPMKNPVKIAFTIAAGSLFALIVVTALVACLVI